MKKLFAAVLLLIGIGFWACQKEYSYETNADATSTGSWEFKDSAGTTYAGNPQDYYIDDTSNRSSAFMQYSGLTANQRGALSISISFPTGTATAGTYTSALGQVDFTYSLSNGVVYRAESANQLSTENITVVISQITDTSVTGTFSGIALDSTNKLKIVKEGKFTYKKRGAATSPVTPVSAGTLGTSTDTCTGAIVSGTYRKGTALTSNNTVTITANITTTGTYIIYSDTLKGIYFRGTGTFTNTGAQSVVIPAVGTPADSGTVRFRIRYGTSSCTFRVKIDTASVANNVIVIPPTGDYFPTTTNSNWSYDINDSGATTRPDTAFVRSTGATSTISGNSYNWFVINDGTTLDTSYYRKSAGLYYTAEDLSTMGNIGGVVVATFLKDNVAQGANWTDTFNVTFNGSPAVVRFSNTILAKQVAATVGSISSADVIKVGTNISISTTIAGFPVTYPYLYQESWFAKGGGLIYSKQRDVSGATPTEETKLRRLTIF